MIDLPILFFFSFPLYDDRMLPCIVKILTPVLAFGCIVLLCSKVVKNLDQKCEFQ